MTWTRERETLSDVWDLLRLCSGMAAALAYVGYQNLLLILRRK